MGVAEWLLRRAAGEERGVAVYGDLVELAAARGQMWFWIAYARTVISLTWRTPAAFVMGGSAFLAASRSWMFLPREWWWEMFHSPHPYFLRGILDVACLLWFLVPFAAVRYGTSDRLVRLAFAACAMVSVACLIVPVFPLFLSVMALALFVVVGALFSTEWRGAAIALGCTTAGSVFVELTLIKLVHIGAWYYMKRHFGPHFSFWDDGFALPIHLFRTVVWTMFALNALAITFISTRFHRRFVGKTSVAS